MKKIKFHFKSLYLELTLSALFSVLLGFLLYFVLNNISMKIAYSDWASSTYSPARLTEDVADFKSYVEENDVKSTDYDKLWDWSVENNLVYFFIAMDNYIVFDSTVYINEDDYESSEELSDLINENLEYVYADSYYTSNYKRFNVTFSDGEGILFIFTDYQYELYTRLLLLAVILAFLFALLILTLLIRKKIRYINEIMGGIHILEGGNLGFNIPVKGNDELSQLADNLNSMRVALSQQMENEKKALTANASLVTALSHDLRTPLTTQMGYLEILKEHHYKDSAEMDKYINTALSTCHQIKEMSDRLFEYFLAFDPNPKRSADTLEEYDGMELFMQLISEHMLVLENQGFRFEMDLPEESFLIHVNMDDVLRICDNVFSNIDKYADESEPVNISISLSEASCLISFTNKIRKEPRKNESSKIGLISISSLMKRQGGSSITKTSSDYFTITLKLPVGQP